MNIEINKYIGRAVIRYLNGDMKLFKYYQDMALQLLEKEKEFIAIGDLIDTKTKNRLYKMVS